MKTRLTLLIIAAATLSLSAQQQPAQGRGGAQGGGAAGRGAARGTPPPAAPASGSAGIYKSNNDLMDVLKKNIAAANGEMSSSNIANTDQYSINIVHRTKAAGAIAHQGNTELHYVIEGSATFVSGGTIVRPVAGAGGMATIENGVTRHVTKGDVVIVPENSPHWYKDIEGGNFTYLEVRWVAPKK